MPRRCRLRRNTSSRRSRCRVARCRDRIWSGRGQGSPRDPARTGRPLSATHAFELSVTVRPWLPRPDDPHLPDRCLGSRGGERDIGDPQPGNLREPQARLEHQLDDRTITRMIGSCIAKAGVLRLGQHTGWAGLAFRRQEMFGGGLAQCPSFDEEGEEGADRRDATPTGTGGMPQGATVRQVAREMPSLYHRDGSDTTALLEVLDEASNIIPVLPL